MYRVGLFAFLATNILVPNSAAAPPTPCTSPITDLGSPSSDSNYSVPWAISDDGSVAAGFADTPSISRSFRWEGGSHTLIPSISTNTTSQAWDISGDATTIVGSSETDAAYLHAYRWEGDATGGTLIDLGTLAGPDAYSHAYGVNYNGTIIVGISDTSTGRLHAFRWEGDSSGGTMIDIGTLSGPDAYSTAYGVNPTGTIIVGSSQIASSGHVHAFRWEGDSAGGVMIDLGTLVGPTGYSLPYRTNTDGTVIIGESLAADGYSHPFRWQGNASGGVMTDLGLLPGYSSGYANATDASGRSSSVPSTTEP